MITKKGVDGMLLLVAVISLGTVGYVTLEEKVYPLNNWSRLPIKKTLIWPSWGIKGEQILGK